MERITRDDSAVCLIDHQVGLLSGVRDITINELKHNVVGLAKAARILGIPTIASTTAKDVFWRPTFPELVAVLDPNEYPIIDRMTMNAWDAALDSPHGISDGRQLQPHNEVVSIPLIAPDYQMHSNKVSLPYQAPLNSSL
jgi:nicotinamidase-related amidase